MMEIEEKIKELFESGKTKPYQIAKELQIDTKDVRKHLREMTEEGKIDNSGTVKRIQKRQEEVEKLLKDDKRAKEIAKILDVSTYTIREDIKHLKARGKVQSIQEENTHKKSEQEESKEESNQNRIIELYEADKTQKEIAEILGISINKLKKTLENLLAEGKIESKHEIRKKQIRTLCEAEKTQEKIAEILKISPTTVSRYVRELKAEGLDIKKQQRSKKKRKQRKEKIIRKEKARLLYEDEKTQGKIAKELNISESTVTNYIKELKQEGKIKERPKKTKQQQEREEVVRKLYSKKKTYREIAETIGISVSGIYRIVSELKAEGLIKERKITKKERLDEIERLYKAGKTQTEIAKKLGVSPTTINREIKKHGIVRGNGELESVEELTNRK